MAFWSRYIFVVAFCVVLPLLFAFYQDTQAAIGRSEAAGTQWAKSAPETMVARLTLEAHKTVATALSIASQVTDEKLLADLDRPARRPIAIRSMISILNNHSTSGGFAWAVTKAGAVIARSGQTDVEEGPDHITGVPLFVSSQEGFALDGLYEHNGELHLVGAVPLVDGRAAAGAILVGKPLNKHFLLSLHAGRDSAVSLVVKGKVSATTHGQPAFAAELARQVGDSEQAVLGGRLAVPLESGILTPMFVENDLNGLAYTSISMAAPGSPNTRWILSMASGESLRDLADRQQTFLGLMLAALLLSVFFGLLLQRTFAKPIDTLIDHLSGIQTKIGADRELEEFRVSGPFKRLVKLINMTVNKLPVGNSPLSPRGSVTDMAIPSLAPPRQESTVVPVRADTSTGMPAAGGLPPPAITGAAPLVSEEHGMSVIPMGSSGGMPIPSDGGLAPPMAPPITAAEPPLPGGMPLAAPPMPVPMASSGMPAPAPPMAAPPMAAPPMAAPPMAAPPMAPGGMPVPDAPAGGGAAAMLQQIASMHASADNAPPMAPKSAADIRGKPSADLGDAPEPAAAQSGLNPLDMPASRPPPAVLDEPPLPGSGGAPRMGGSLGSVGLGSAGVPEEEEEEPGFPSESTVVAKVTQELLDATRSKTTGGHDLGGSDDDHVEGEDEAPADRTVIAMVPKELLQESAAKDSTPTVSKPNGANGVDGPDHAHFKETYERFIEMRRNCGEPTADLSFDRFVAKLRKNRDGLIKKYSCKTVRFQVYEKDGKAALKATPIRN